MDEKTRQKRDEYREQVERRLNECIVHGTFEERVSVKDVEWLAKFHIVIYGDNRG